jgi:hypothetical protein
MEQAGAVFLPVGGYLAPNGMYAVGSNGYYWSATKFQDEQAVYFDLQAKQVRRGIQFRYFGSAVRLVKTFIPITTALPNMDLQSPETKTQMIFHNGQLLIIHNGRTYNANGTLMQ